MLNNIINNKVMNFDKNNNLKIDISDVTNYIKNLKQKMMENKYDYVVVGGGPAGIMASYNLSQNHPTKKILLLEKHNSEYDDYLSSGYGNVYRYAEVQNSTAFSDSFLSEDNKTVWYGLGLGGGTNHFGLQYIDQDEIINGSGYSEWLNSASLLGNLKEKINNITQVFGYDYNDYDNVQKELIDNNIGNYRNKIYSESKPTLPNTNRYLPGKLLVDNPNIIIHYSKNINKLNISNSNVESVEDFSGNKYYGDKYLVCAGAIQTPAIMQRSGIDCGNSLYDHGAFNLVYGKYSIETNTSGTGAPAIGTINDSNTELSSFTLNNTALRAINNATNNVCLLKVKDSNNNYFTNDDGNIVVWNLYGWAETHGNKWYSYNPILEQKNNQNQTLNYPHDSSRWTGRINNNEITEVGIENSSITWSSLKSALISPSNVISISDEDLTKIYNALFTGDPIVVTKNYIPEVLNGDSNLISSLQTRDTSLNWQTYITLNYPTLENNIIITFSQSTNLSGSGSVKIKSISNEKPEVYLNHLVDSSGTIESLYVDDLFDCFETVHSKMVNLGYKLVNFESTENSDVFNGLFSVSDSLRDNFETYLQPLVNSIYHYHGSCKELVESQPSSSNPNLKVKNVNNLYIGDVSVLDKPWGGSTSFPALVTGYIASSGI